MDLEAILGGTGSEEVKPEKEENGLGCIDNGWLSGITGAEAY